MTDIEKKALALVNEVLKDFDHPTTYTDITDAPEFAVDHALCRAVDHALCRAIEQHEAFRREVSDALIGWYQGRIVPEHFAQFILPTPVDPLVEVLREAGEQTGGHVSNERLAHDLREAMKARGYEWTKIGDAA